MYNHDLCSNFYFTAMSLFPDLNYGTCFHWFLNYHTGCIYCHRKINGSPRLVINPWLIQIAAVSTFIIVVEATSAHTDSKCSLVALWNISRTIQPAKLTVYAGLIEEKTAANGQTVRASFKSGYWDDGQGHILTKFITPHHHYQSPYHFSIHHCFPAILFTVPDLMTGSTWHWLRNADLSA